MSNTVGDCPLQGCLNSNRLDPVVWSSVDRLVYRHCGLYSRDLLRVIAECPVDDSLSSPRTVQHHNTVV